MAFTNEVIGWDICPYCGETYKVYAVYISQRRTHCEHIENGIRVWHSLIFIRKET